MHARAVVTLLPVVSAFEIKEQVEKATHDKT